MAKYDITTAAAFLEFDTQQAGLFGSLKAVDTNHVLIVDGSDSGFDIRARVLAIDTSAWTITAAGSVLTIDASASGIGRYDCVAIDETHYVALYQQSDGHLHGVVLAVNTTTWAVTTAGAVLELYAGGAVGGFSAEIVGDNHIVYVLRGSGYDGFAQVIAVNTTTWAITTTMDPLEFDTQFGIEPDIVGIDTNHFLVCWGGDSGYDGYAQVFVVNTSTWVASTAAASLEFDTQQGRFNTLAQVDATHYLNFYQGVTTDTNAIILVVNTTTWAVTTAIDIFQLTADSRAYGDIAQVDDNHFFITYAGSGEDGYVNVLSVNTSTWAISTTQAPLEYDTQLAKESRTLEIESGKFMVVWRDTASDGKAQMFDVEGVEVEAPVADAFVPKVIFID